MIRLRCFVRRNPGFRILNFTGIHQLELGCIKEYFVGFRILNFGTCAYKSTEYEKKTST